MKIQINLTDDQVYRLDQLAKELKISRSSLIRECIGSKINDDFLFPTCFCPSCSVNYALRNLRQAISFVKSNLDGD